MQRVCEILHVEPIIDVDFSNTRVDIPVKKEIAGALISSQDGDFEVVKKIGNNELLERLLRHSHADFQYDILPRNPQKTSHKSKDHTLFGKGLLHGKIFGAHNSHNSANNSSTKDY